MSLSHRHRSDLPPSPAATRRDPMTYRHPRTLVEAFGPDARTACAIEKHDDALGAAKALTHWVCWLSAAAVALAALVLLF